MSKTRIAVIDFETTGLIPSWNERIIEIGVVVIDDYGNVHGEYETLVNPRRDLGATWLHGISASDVQNAPGFDDVAGDMVSLLAECDVVAGHNVSFDVRFLINELERAGAKVPSFPAMCTYRLLGGSLSACCRDLGIEFDGHCHQALADARATSKLVAYLCDENPSVVEQFRLERSIWPAISPRQTPPFARKHAIEAANQPPRFLQRLAQRLDYDLESEPEHVAMYGSMLLRILEDRFIDDTEEEELVVAATSLGLSMQEVMRAHERHLQDLVALACSDGVISEGERRDLACVARLLGYAQDSLDRMLCEAERQLARAGISMASTSSVPDELIGKRVCFTGELISSIDGKPVQRAMAHAFAERAGMVVATSVTKKLDVLVVADPCSQSGKAKKAREYGTRIIAEAVFWKMIGVTVD